MALLHPASASPAANRLRAILAQLDQTIIGKPRQTRLALACLLAGGHLLLEDLPGMGKTTLAHGLAAVLGLDFKRIQFTSDLLPADILGVSIYEANSSQFRFHPGPVFAQLVLADEINRASPKAQSALLEAMEERQVTADGQTYPLPKPFFVIATQNPQQLVGTFPLPESQLDRFLMRLTLGYPDRAAERAVLKQIQRTAGPASSGPMIPLDELANLQQAVRQVHCSEALLDYVQDLIEATRTATHFAHGLSPRAGQALIAAARAWAFVDGRQSVIPEDVQAVAPHVMCHRLQAVAETGADSDALVLELLRHVPIP